MEKTRGPIKVSIQTEESGEWHKRVKGQTTELKGL